MDFLDFVIIIYLNINRMIKEKTCCEFFIGLCKKICVKKSSEEVKPETGAGQIGLGKVVKECQGPGLMSYRSSIVKGNPGVSISNPSVGFVQTIETSELKYSDEGKGKKGMGEYGDLTVFTEQIAQEVVMNMEEAYNIIKREGISEESEMSESNRSHEFAKKVKKLDFKSILAENSVSEDSC